MGAVCKLGRALGLALWGYWTIRYRFPQLTAQQRADTVQAWAGRMLDILGIGREVQGAPPTVGPVLLVANHISWLDILVLHAACYCRFVAKADVQGWPLIGTLATGAGTLYVQREVRRDAMRVVHHMADALRAGDVLAIFPEGTTSDGSQVLPFHANLFQSAVSAQAPVQAAAITYRDAATRAPSFAPIYVDDETLLASLWRTLRTPQISAQLCFGTPLDGAGQTRRGLADQAHAAVAQLRAHGPIEGLG